MVTTRRSERSTESRERSVKEEPMEVTPQSQSQRTDTTESAPPTTPPVVGLEELRKLVEEAESDSLRPDETWYC